MKRIIKNNTIEPDFNTELEEIAEIPEKISVGADVDGERPPRDDEDGVPLRDVDLEEVAAPLGAFDESRIIVDEYDGRISAPVPKYLDKRNLLLIKNGTQAVDAREPLFSYDDLDIGSVAAEIDALVKREPKKELRQEPSSLTAEVDDMPLVSHHMDFMDTPEEHDGSVLIEENDDIDLDYYSLDEVKSEMADPLESFEYTPPVKELPPAPQIPAAIKEAPPAPQGSAAVKEDARGRADSKPEPVKKETRRKKDNTITIEVPEYLRNKLPKDFNIDDLGIIDLREAEAIANEDIILLSEDELIEELEEFDLTPGKKTKPPVEHEEDAEADQEEAGDRKETIAEAAAPDQGSPDPSREVEFVDEDRGGGDEAGGDVIVEEVVLTDETSEPLAVAADNEEPKKTVTGDRMTDEEEVGDLSGIDQTFQASREQAAPGGSSDDSVASTATTHVEEIEVRDKSAREEPIEVDRRYAGTDVPADTVQLVPQNQPTRKGLEAERAEIKIEEIPARTAPRVAQDALMVKEVLPVHLLRREGRPGAVRFIDDGLLESPGQETAQAFSMDELERISSEIVQVVEGDAILLSEGDSTEDFTRIAGIMRGTTPAFEDLLQDLKEEQGYRDEEIGIVSSVFEAEDYSDYIKTIDEQPGAGLGRKGSAAIEILGLERREINDLESAVFMREYEKVNIEEALGGTRPGMDQPEHDVRLLKRCRYIMTHPDSLSGAERQSIEEDVLSESALVFEESIGQVKERLNELKKQRGLPPEKFEELKSDVSQGAAETNADISDNVFIIDDKTDLERFFSTIPEDKRENLTKLLKYLDGLFEKLPEEVVRKFASSEYFDIYTKVLNDLGV